MLGVKTPGTTRSMSDDEERAARTGFARDSREFFTKLAVGIPVGFAIYAIIWWVMRLDTPWWLALVLGEWAVFGFAKAIHGSSRYAE